MTTHQNAQQPGFLAALTSSAFFVVANDPELYQTAECLGTTLIETWLEIMFCPVEFAPTEEVIHFVEFAANEDNWNLDPDGKPAVLVWNVGGESSGTITFYRVAHDRPNQKLSSDRSS